MINKKRNLLAGKTLKTMTLASGLILLLNACGGGGGGTPQGNNPTPIQNIVPEVHAGADLNAVIGKEVTIGMTALDTDGNIKSYEWKEGNTVLSTKASFIKSDFSRGEHILTATATDDDGATSSDTLVLRVGEYVITSKKGFKDAEDIPEHSTKYTYNVQGLLAKFESFNGAETLPYTIKTWSYDSNGLVSVKC